MTTVERKQYMKIWRFENRDKIRKQRRAWERRNPDKVRAHCKAWVAKNSARVSAYMRDWRDRNRESRSISQAKWSRNNPFRVMMHKFKHLSSNHSASLFPALLSLDAIPGYEYRILIDRITPLDELIMKEEGLL